MMYGTLTHAFSQPHVFSVGEVYFLHFTKTSLARFLLEHPDIDVVGCAVDIFEGDEISGEWFWSKHGHLL